MKNIKSKLALLLQKLEFRLCKINYKSRTTVEGCFRTYSRVKFNTLNPTFDMIVPEDIVRGLAHKPHFSGFSPKFFSIAEHSILVCDLYEMCNPDDYIGQLQALIHDGSEAYTGDMIKPIKNLLPNFVLIENRIQNTIYQKYNIDPEIRKAKIKEIDNHIQDIEADAFYHYDNLDSVRKNIVDKWIKYLSPTEAYYAYWKRFNEITSKIKTDEV